MIDSDIKDDLKPDLGINEKLIWTGKPKTGIRFRSSDILIIPFSLFYTGNAFAMASQAIESDGPLLFKLWMSLFFVIGLYMVAGRFFADARKRANMVYGITQERILIKSGIFSRKVKFFKIAAISDMLISQKADLSGTITFEPASLIQDIQWPDKKRSPKLEFIEDVKSVYDKIISIQKQNDSR
jgi:hypothetical protein